VTWSLNPPVGTITSGGLYTAPASITAEQVVSAIATSSTGQTGWGTILLEPGPSNCTYSLALSNPSFTVAGGTGTVTVATQAGCSWVVLNPTRFVTVTSAAGGIGSSSVSFSLAPNTATARNARTTIGGATVILSQAGLFAPPGSLFLPVIVK
jgi:hypothetical protein